MTDKLLNLIEKNLTEKEVSPEDRKAYNMALVLKTKSAKAGDVKGIAKAKDQITKISKKYTSMEWVVGTRDIDRAHHNAYVSKLGRNGLPEKNLKEASDTDPEWRNKVYNDLYGGLFLDETVDTKFRKELSKELSKRMGFQISFRNIKGKIETGNVADWFEAPIFKEVVYSGYFENKKLLLNGKYSFKDGSGSITKTAIVTVVDGKLTDINWF